MSDIKLNTRTLKEIKAATENKAWRFFMDSDGKYGPKNDCYLKWTVEAGIYKGQTHVLQISWCYTDKKGENKQYPRNAPFVRFYTPILHPNVFGADGICLDILGGGFGHTEEFDKWSPMYGLNTIHTSIIALMDDEKFYKSSTDLRIAQCNEHYARKMTDRFLKVLKWPEFDSPEEDPLADSMANLKI
jgi:ubiquitin-protein ligase